MSTATRNRCSSVRNFVICFYCKENFRSLTALSKHYCSEAKKITLGWESHETASDANDVDLSHVDWDLSNVDLSQNDWDSHERVSDTNDCDLDQENSVCSMSESNGSNICEGSMPETECKQLSEMKSDAARQKITGLASDVSDTNVIREEVTTLSADALLKDPLDEILNAIKEMCDKASVRSEKQSLEANSDVVKEVSNQASDTSEKQSSEANSDIVKEVSDQTSDSFGKQSSEANLDIVKEVSDQASNPSRKQLSVASAGTEQNISEVEPNADDELHRAIPDLASKVLQYYEKETKQGTPDSCCKSPSTEIEFQPSSSPLPIIESSSPRQDSTQMECSDTNGFSKGLSSDAMCDTYGEDVTQEKLDELKQDARGLESLQSNICSRSSSPEVDSSEMFSRSSSIIMDFDDSLGCVDDQVESNDSDVSSTISLSEKKSTELKRDHVQAELHSSKIDNKSLPEENLNVIKHGSVILKPCYVKVHDIFKSVSNSKLSPKKIFSRKKKYHVCDVCSKFFRLRSDLNTHYLIHTSVKPYICNICGKSFLKQYNLFAHHLAHSVTRNYGCSVCKRKFPNRSLLLRHQQIHTKEKPFACDKCNKSYSAKSSLNEHYLSHSDERPFVCEICSASFQNRRYLRKHYYRHQKKENVCEFCFRSFKHKHNLDEHYNIHVNERPHECKVCGKSFHLLLTLNNHFAVAHKEERDLLFQEKLKSLVESMSVEDPVIHRIQKSTRDHKGDKIPVKKSEKSAVVDKGEKTPVKKIKISLDDKSKETVPYSSTRRKSLTPKKHLQAGFILY